MTEINSTKANVLLCVTIYNNEYQKMLLESGWMQMTSCDEPGLVKYASKTKCLDGYEKYFKRVECTISERYVYDPNEYDHNKNKCKLFKFITFIAPHTVYGQLPNTQLEDREVTLQVPSYYLIEIHHGRLVTVGIKKTRWIIHPDAEYIGKPIEDIITPKSNGLLLDIKGKLEGGDYGFVKIPQQYDVIIDWNPNGRFLFPDLEHNYSMGYHPNVVYAPSDRLNNFF
uniref:Uncharacterized protein n=1 Tax=viral metagenome TaxID=1070528 RepID=A0A6C0E6W3_9ZZZZ